jgi:exopolyphosphatase/guanosine-5'-triphosphate,3'-diphosphate pyrophosphatase
MSPPRAAVIDVGTNSVLLTIAARTDARHAEAPAPAHSPPGPASTRPPATLPRLQAELERATITRLGQGVDQTRQLAPAAVERTLACLRAYGEEVRRAEVAHVALVGTSALRDVAGAQAFLDEASRLVGAPLEVISGAREAELTFRGSLSGLDVDGPVRVFDIGGGSTEIIAGTAGADGRAHITLAHSYDVGSVRLTERHVRTDPPTSAELEAVRADIRSTWRAPAAPSWGAEPRPGDSSDAPTAPTPTIVGVAGTVTTLAALALRLESYDPERVHGATLLSAEVESLAQKLAALPLAERQKLPGLEPRRADVIVAGALLCAEVLQLLGAHALRVSDRGVRWGLLEELLLPTASTR